MPISVPASGGIRIVTVGVQLQEKTASGNIIAGQWIYAISSNQVAVADNSTAEKAAVVGIAAYNANSGEPCKYVAVDDVEIEGFAGLTANEKYVLSSTAGAMELLSEMTASEQVTYLCTAQSGTKLKTKIEVTGLTA